MFGYIFIFYVNGEGLLLYRGVFICVKNDLLFFSFLIDCKKFNLMDVFLSYCDFV